MLARLDLLLLLTCLNASVDAHCRKNEVNQLVQCVQNLIGADSVNSNLNINNILGTLTQALTTTKVDCDSLKAFFICTRTTADCLNLFRETQITELTTYRIQLQLHLLKCFDYSAWFSQPVNINTTNVHYCLQQIALNFQELCIKRGDFKYVHGLQCLNHYYLCLGAVMESYCGHLSIFEKVAVCDVQNYAIHPTCVQPMYCNPTFLSFSFRKSGNFILLLVTFAVILLQQ